ALSRGLGDVYKRQGNWSSGLPGAGSQINIPGGTSPVIFGGTMTVSPPAALNVAPGGALTVTGDLASTGSFIIGSTISSSGSLIVGGTATGNITYNRQLLPGDNIAADWHLAAPPVTANSETNTGKITALYQWSEPTGTWTTTGITSAVAGRGYNIRQEPGSDGMIGFTGPLANGDVITEASSPYADAVSGDASYFARLIADGRSLENPGGKGWNLLGNPYPSGVNASAFINANYSVTPSLSQFDPNYVALYLFDGTGRQYYYLASSTGWPSGNELSETHVQAGQGFFVLAMNDNSVFRFTKAMQEHSTATPMLKSGKSDDRWPGLQLKIKHPGGEVVTTVVYNGSMTAGVDPGYDIGLFKSGQDLEIYTSLALKDNGINYTRQALPLSGADTLAVPVGIDFKSGGEVTFSAVTVPVDGRRLWLHDRVTGSFTDLSLKSYTATLPADTYGTGRFFIVASANTPTAIDRSGTDDGELRIWTSGGRLVIQGMVAGGSLCELYDIHGRKMLEQNLSDAGLNTIELPAGLHGVAVVKVTDGSVVTTRKLVIPEGNNH
ncbi:MAG: T9SS type A sorting domain-containing protein, partial [Bacteroidota bacterium]|nr:T9SS type A sorting domain-containing protein [Bacteroidota bacterium]